ncbi:MAG: hypothetical protein HY320_12220 [Armatimonadetes bacterium]|nr:hypothetical protein [Armatimonadota bacterium]
MGDETLERLKARHAAFWAMAEVDAPLLSVGRYQPLASRPPIPLADGTTATEGMRLTPDSIDPRRLVGIHAEPSTPFAGDFIHGVALYDLCWMEATTGCPLYWRAGQVWSEPGGWSAWDDLERLRVAPDNAWLARLLTLTRLLVERAQGHYPIVQPLLRGPIDIATAVLGDGPACLLMKDDPDRFRRLLEVCTDNFITVAQAWMAAAEVCHGGCCAYGIWASGTVLRTQADNAALLSPQDYHDFLKPFDERICAAFDYPFIHTHSGVLHIMADALLAEEPLRAVQVVLDYPAGPPLVDLLPLFRRLNKHKPLIITGGLTAEELELLRGTLSPRGLCLSVSLHD